MCGGKLTPVSHEVLFGTNIESMKEWKKGGHNLYSYGLEEYR
jgi:hypothetical protein